MSCSKRTYSAEDCSATINDNNPSLADNNIQLSSPNDSPQSKKARRSALYPTTTSENDEETQEYQHEYENGITNGKNHSLNLKIKITC